MFILGCQLVEIAENCERFVTNPKTKSTRDFQIEKGEKEEKINLIR